MLRPGCRNTPIRRLGILAVTFVFLTQAAYATTFACTPGFWKNHTEEWCDAYTPETLLTDVFDGVPSSLSGDSLLDAMKYGGGNTLDEKKQLLLHHAVATLLNVCHEDFGWGGIATTQDVIDITNEVLGYNVRSAVVDQAQAFDYVNNNQLACPLPLNDSE
jgi:hypothetical protein